MNENTKKLVEKMRVFKLPATTEAINHVENEMGIVFPKQYKEFMLESNGADGPIGEESYLSLWEIEEIISANEDLCVEVSKPGLAFFASDGGGTAYAFDKRKEMCIVEIPDDSIDIEEAELCGNTFEEFLQYLYEKMDHSNKKFTEKLNLNPPATEEKLRQAEVKLNIEFPLQYKEFILASNGAEGSIGNNSYLAIWSSDDIAQYNDDYQVDEYNPGLVYFGSDGGGMVYAFDNRSENTPIVTLPFISIDFEEVEPCGDTFEEFLEYLYNA